MGRSKRKVIPATPEEGWPWLARQQREAATRRGNQQRSGKSTPYQRRQAEDVADIAERLAWAKAHPDRAAEVGVTLEDRTKRYDLEIVDGMPRLVDRSAGAAS